MIERGETESLLNRPEHPYTRELLAAALLNLTFNQGIGWVGKNPQMYAALQVRDYAKAAAALLDGPYKDQVGARAYRIAKQIEEDVWV